jgi:hypothetical protein
MSTFEAVREVTGWVRPKGGHGCTPTEVFAGVFTAHYHDIDTRVKLLDAIGGTMPSGGILLVNSAVCQVSGSVHLFTGSCSMGGLR